MRNTEKEIELNYKEINSVLPPEIKFLHSEELLTMYPDTTAKEREAIAAREYGAIFIMGIGGRLSNGEAHDGRAPDYDDWSTQNEDGYIGLNGDIIVWHPLLKCPLELSSMGIRVNPEALMKQLNLKGCPERSNLLYHSMLLNGSYHAQLVEASGNPESVCLCLKRDISVKFRLVYGQRSREILWLLRVWSCYEFP